jgi:alpha-1,3-rhamnosyl/mannosyltransferase
MNLVVNVASLRAPLTGIGNYTLHILNEILSIPQVGDVVGISGHTMLSRDQLAELVGTLLAGAELQSSRGSGVSLRSNAYNLAKVIPGARRLRDAYNNRRLVKNSLMFKGYIYWEPNYILARIHCPAVTTVHDISHIRFPQYHPRDRVKYLLRNLQESLSRAERVVCVSEFTKSELMSEFSVASEQIDIVTPSVDARFRKVFTEVELRDVRARYQLPEKYILSVGTIEPRKNLLGLLQAYEALSSDLQKEFPLVLVGGSGWLTESIEKQLIPLEAKGVIRRLGFVSGKDIPALYKLASLMAYPSFYEGFGMPILESMATGTPVLTSNVASMPEVASGAACLIQPHDTDSIAEGLTKLLSDSLYCNELSVKGLEVASGCNWALSAGNLITTMNSVRQRGESA